MVWIRRYDPKEVHVCVTPAQKHGTDIWACDTCGKVYIARVVYSDGEHDIFWYAANWWAQHKYHPRFTCGCKIGKDNVCGSANGIMHGILYPEVAAPEDISTLFDPPEKGL